MNTRASKIMLGLSLFAVLVFTGCDPSTAPAKKTVDQILEVREKDWIKGGQNAKVTLVEYSDFQCPACDAFYPVLKQAATEYPDDVRVVYRHYPLSQHAKAVPAARAAEAAGAQGKFWEMHDLIFDNQDTWATASDHESIFQAYAEQLGLDMDKFKADYNARDTRKRIEDDKKDDDILSIQGTPTIYLNKQKISTMPYSDLKQLIEKAINGQPLTAPTSNEPDQPL